MIVGWRLAAGGGRRPASHHSTVLHLADSAGGLTFVALAAVAGLSASIWAAARRGIQAVGRVQLDLVSALPPLGLPARDRGPC